MKKITSLVLTTVIYSAVCFGLVQKAAAELIVNGDFETTTAGNGELGYNTAATGWTTSGYNFLYAPGTADTTGALGEYGVVTLWGPNNGSANGFPAASPTGGNFLAADGAFQVGAISQTVTGLTVGNTYALSFYWGGAQQNGFTGPTTEQWQVSLGSQTISTAILDNVDHGFTGWQQETFSYTATATSELLSFLAVGTPAGVPPFSVLDGVSMSEVPEPTTITLLIILSGVCAARILRRKVQA